MFNNKNYNKMTESMSRTKNRTEVENFGQISYNKTMVPVPQPEAQITGRKTISISDGRSGIHKVKNNDNSNKTACPDCGGLLVRIGYCHSCLLCGWGSCS